MQAAAVYQSDEMTFRKRTARGKTLLQNSRRKRAYRRASWTPLPKTPNGCGVAMSQRPDRLPAHDLKKHIWEFFRGGPGARLCLQERAPRTPCGEKETISEHNMSFDLARARADTPGCSDVLHFNNAGASLMPQPVLNSVIDYLRLESRTGGYEAAELSREKLASVYDSAARLINCRS